MNRFERARLELRKRTKRFSRNLLEAYVILAVSVGEDATEEMVYETYLAVCDRHETLNEVTTPIWSELSDEAKAKNKKYMEAIHAAARIYGDPDWKEPENA